MLTDNRRLLVLILIAIRRLSLFLLLVVTEVVVARMYQWTEPDTGTTQLSGKPPVWYRSGEGGPRTLVFDNGILIDDTAAIKVSDERRRAMRQQALAEAVGEVSENNTADRLQEPEGGY